jgi:hypothetical protein
MVSPTYLDRAHNYMMDTWTWDFAYERWDVGALKEMLFWFAASGQAISHESTTEEWFKEIQLGRVRGIKAHAARERWADIEAVVPALRSLDEKAAFGWFGKGRSREAWQMLQNIKYVGPKIASWLLRDLSFLRDYATDTGGTAATYSYPARNRNAAWFRELPVQDQALFLPLDRWVIRGAQDYGIVSRSLSIGRIQSHLDRYVEAASAIVSWAHRNDLEPRDLNVYFYLTGTESLGRDGTCPIAEGDSVWWCYDGTDRVDSEQDWLEGEVVQCTPTEATVRIEGQLQDLRTRKPISEQRISIPCDLLRVEE